MPAPAAPRRRGPRRALTEQAILDAALSLLDEGGPGAASIRRIAARVDVAPNAIYTYFPRKTAVLRAVAERLLDGVDHDALADRGRPWRIRAGALALELRTTLIAHPGAAVLLVASPLDGPSASTLDERLVELFTDAGLGRAGAAGASYLVMDYVFGSVAREVTGIHDGGPLSPGYEPSAARAASTEQFVWGLDRILDGLSAWAGTKGEGPSAHEGANPPRTP